MDFPQADRLTVHILTAVAEHEGRMISERTKNALAAAKARGKQLGNPEYMTPEGRANGTKAGNHIKKMKADAYALEMSSIVEELKGQGQNLSQIAASLNHAHILSPRGNSGKWTPTAVKNILNRLRLR